MQDSQHKFKHGWEMGKEDKPLTRCALRDSCGNRVKTTGMQPCLSKYIFVLKEFPSSAQLWEFVPLQVTEGRYANFMGADLRFSKTLPVEAHAVGVEENFVSAQTSTHQHLEPECSL
eukprot:scaffold25447_cov23-Tisochrysis_lutea.AAC.1